MMFVGLNGFMQRIYLVQVHILGVGDGRFSNSIADSMFKPLNLISCIIL